MSTLPVSYTSVEKILTAISPLGSVSTLTSSVMQRGAGEMEARINAVLSRRYTIPFTEYVPILDTISTMLSVQHLLKLRYINFAEIDAEALLGRFDQANEDLLAIATGSLQMINSSGTVIAERGDLVEVWSSTEDYHQTFHEGAWPDMFRDPDKLDDIEDERDI